MEYVFDMEAALTKEQVFELLQSHFPLRQSDWGGREGNRILQGTYVSVAIIERERKTEVGFVSRSSALLQCIMTPEAWDTSFREMMAIIVVLLKHVDGNAVLLEYSEAIVLQRLDGQLTLNTIPFRRQEYQQTLDLITLPYGMEELPYPYPQG